MEVTLDQWHLHPGDQLPAFIERHPRQRLHPDRMHAALCRAFEPAGWRCGLRGDIMTAEVVTQRNERKFIPSFRAGPKWEAAAPSWLTGKYRIDLRGNPYSEPAYTDLTNTLHRTRPAAPPVVPRSTAAPASTPPVRPKSEAISILNVIVDEVSTPRNGRTRGSALYRVPFQLSRSPTRL